MMMQSFQTKKKYLVMPLLVIPFITLAFYALGGGSGAKKKTAVINELNMKLPSSHAKENKGLNKLSFYEKADKDSAVLAESKRNDPYFMMKDSSELERLTGMAAMKYHQPLNLSPNDEKDTRPEDKILMKLKLLQDELNTAHAPGKENKNTHLNSNDDLDRLEEMAEVMNGHDAEDGEIKQLSAVMDKILDVQHPERVKERIKARQSLTAKKVFEIVSREEDSSSNGFYGSENYNEEDNFNSIAAVVHEDQTLINGSIIKLRLRNDAFINKEKIPAGNFVYGVVSLNGERLDVTISSIRVGNSVYDVRLALYDLDGLPGMYIPGAISRDVAKQNGDNAIRMMELNSVDPSLKAQATAAGIGTVKNLLGKKIKLKKVMVKAGYHVLLKNETN